MKLYIYYTIITMSKFPNNLIIKLKFLSLKHFIKLKLTKKATVAARKEIARTAP